MHNSEHLLKKMKKKGWSEDEIEHARIVFSEHELKHHVYAPIWDIAIHWFLFLVIIIANVFAFVFMLPMIIVADSIYTYLILGVLGLGMGLVFEIVINDMSHLQKHHHFFVALLVPLLSICFMLIVMYSIQQRVDFIIDSFRHSLQISVTYAVCFMLPYYLRLLGKSFTTRG